MPPCLMAVLLTAMFLTVVRAMVWVPAPRADPGMKVRAKSFGLARNVESLSPNSADGPIVWAVAIPLQMYNNPVVGEAAAIAILKACLGSSCRTSRLCCIEC